MVRHIQESSAAPARTGRAVIAAVRSERSAEVKSARRQPWSVSTRCLFLLTLFASCAAVHLARPILVPILLASLAHLALSPVVRGAQRLGISPPLVAVGTFGLALAVSAVGIVYLVEPAQSWVEKLPKQLANVREQLRTPLENVEKVTEAAQTIDEMTDLGGESGLLTVSQVKAGSPLLTGTTDFAAQALITLFLLFAMMASHGSFLRSLVSALPRFTDKRLAVTVVNRIGYDVSRYLFLITLINMVLGACIGAGLWMVGLPNPVLWGLMAAVFNFVPYAGAMLGVGIIGLVALAAFQDPARAALAMGLYASLTTLEGGILTPMLVGHRLRLRPVIVLIWLLLWSFLWGIVGALTAIPMLVALKILCEHLPSMSPLSAFLARVPKTAARRSGAAAPDVKMATF